MQRDNQGRQLLRLPTTMRVAFEAALKPALHRAHCIAFYDDAEDPNLDAIMTVVGSTTSNHGYRKVPAWTVTRKGKR
jgi:hypothetical protein